MIIKTAHIHGWEFNVKKIFCLLLALILLAFSDCSADGVSDMKSTCVTFNVCEDTEFGGVNINASPEEFSTAFSAQFGDSVDVHFSNGFVLEDIPYYNGYYERVNRPVLVNYPGVYIQLAYCSGNPMWKISGSAEGDTVTLSVREPGKYLDRQNAMASVYVDDRAAFDSDETFANFRPMIGGKLRENWLFRGGSPANDLHLRAETTDSLLEKNVIAYVLDLADTEKSFAGYLAKDDFRSDYTAALYESGNIALLGLNAGYRSDAFMASLTKGLRDLTEHEGPYYIHCTEGKDRTGFVCLLLEALAGASFDEIETDYMKTYENYYGITKQSEPAKYEALKELRLLDMLEWLADVPEGTELSGMDFTKAAENYLSDAGMTDPEIAALVAAITE